MNHDDVRTSPTTTNLRTSAGRVAILIVVVATSLLALLWGLRKESRPHGADRPGAVVVAATSTETISRDLDDVSRLDPANASESSARRAPSIVPSSDDIVEVHVTGATGVDVGELLVSNRWIPKARTLGGRVDTRDPSRAAQHVGSSPHSPIRVERRAFRELGARRGIFVGAPGHAWARLDEPAPDVHRIDVRLEPAAEVRVILNGALEEDALVVQLERVDREPTFVDDAEAEAGEVRFRELSPGRYRVRTAPVLAPKKTLAETQVNLTTTRSARVSLDLPVIGTGPFGRLDVEWIGAELSRWNTETRMHVTIVPETPGDVHVRTNKLRMSTAVQHLSVNAAGIPRVEHRVAGLPPGRYCAELEPFGLRRTVEVLPAQVTHLSIDVPVLARTSIAFVDARSGDRVDPKDVTASWRRDDGAWISTRPLDGTRGGGVEFATEPGELSLIVRDAGHAMLGPVRERVLAGTNAVTVELVPSAHLVLRWNDERLGRAPDMDGEVRLSTRTGDRVELGRSVSVGGAATEQQLEFTVPAGVPIDVDVPARGDCPARRLTLELRAGAREERTLTCSP